MWAFNHFYSMRSILHVIVVLCTFAMFSCATDKMYEDSFVLDRVKVVNDMDDVKLPDFLPYVRQRPASKLFSLIRKPGSAPVKYDTLAARQSCEDMRMALQNMGYL